MTAQRQWLIVSGVCVAVAVALGFAAYTMGDRLQAVEPGTKAPEFRAVQITATKGPLVTKTLADYRGKVVLLNIWATWCNPCRAEMPSMQRLEEELGARGLKIVAVSIDNPGMEDAIRAFGKELGLKFEILYDAPGNIRNDYQTTGAPETFVIGKDGVIRKRVIGATDWDSEPQKALLRQLLAEPSP